MCEACPKKCPRCGSTRTHQTFELACPDEITGFLVRGDNKTYKCDSCGATWCDK